MSELNDVFISYNWSIKDQVKLLDEKLINSGFKVWRDERNLETNEKPLTSQLSDLKLVFVVLLPIIVSRITVIWNILLPTT